MYHHPPGSSGAIVAPPNVDMSTMSIMAVADAAKVKTSATRSTSRYQETNRVFLKRGDTVRASILRSEEEKPIECEGKVIGLVNFVRKSVNPRTGETFDSASIQVTILDNTAHAKIVGYIDYRSSDIDLLEEGKTEEVCLCTLEANPSYEGEAFEINGNPWRAVLGFDI